MFSMSVVECRFDFRLDQTNDYNICLERNINEEVHNIDWLGMIIMCLGGATCHTHELLYPVR